MHRIAWLVALLTTASAVSQNEAPLVKKSLAAGLVRHCIERDQLTPPRVLSGLEIGAGKGEMVLIIRRPDGSLHAEALPRGLGNHGPAAKVQKVGEIIEEVVEKAAKPQKPNPKAPNLKAVAVAPVKVNLKRSGGSVFVAIGAAKDTMRSDNVDRTALAKRMAACFATTKNTKTEGQLLLEVSADATMQDVLTCWEVARAAGFKSLMFSPQGRMRILTDKERALITNIPDKFKWQGRKRGPMTVYDGELLVLLDGPTRFYDIAPLIIQCANMGVWQIAFVGQKDKKHRFKLPTHLPTSG